MASGADPIITKDFSCWPWSHQWRQWKDRAQGEIEQQDTDYVVGIFVYQERRCNRCEQIQLRKESCE